MSGEKSFRCRMGWHKWEPHHFIMFVLGGENVGWHGHVCKRCDIPRSDDLAKIREVSFPIKTSPCKGDQ